VWKYVIPPKGQPSQVNATGLIDGSYPYCTSAAGVLFCFDRMDGKARWQQSLEGFGAKKPQIGWTVSPAVAGDLLILAARAYGMAVDERTGELVFGKPGELA